MAALPPPGAPAPAGNPVISRPNAVPAPALPPVMAPGVMQPQTAPVPGSANQLPPNPNLPSPDNFRAQ